MEDFVIPTITPSMVPTKSPGTLFTALTGGDDTLNIRWLVATDPAMYEVLNRPIADVVVRQLVLAKAVDNLQIRLGHQTLFPYLVQPKISYGTTEVDIPIGWIWDIHVSLPKKWEQVRLAKIKRVAGLNGTTDGYSGVLRLVFTANIQNSTTEVAVFTADYNIASTLTYQPVRIAIATSPAESVVVNPGEEETIAGFIIFKTLDINVQSTLDLYNAIAPPIDPTDGNNDGYFDVPAVYEITDTIAGGPAVTDDFSSIVLSHGTGLLTDSAWNAIPQLNSDIQSWITSFNYPFDAVANRRSVDGITIPNGLFREFDIAAPAGDQPTGDASGAFYPVWINRIESIGVNVAQLRFYLATYNITDSNNGGTPSTTPVEFATLDLLRTYQPGDIIEINPVDNLLLKTAGDLNFRQHFGRGHVVLSSLWDGTSQDVANFFDSFLSIVDIPPDTMFTQVATRISSFGISRVPKYAPTLGQSRALQGSTSRRTTPIHPSVDNRYICEQDQGVGNQVDLEAQAGIVPNAAIDRYGFSGALSHRVVRLVIDATQLGTDPAFYDSQVLPRLRILFGRNPAFGDFWYNGTRLMFNNGDSWQG